MLTPERFQQLELLHDRAEALPPAQRAAFIVAACGEDDELRGELAALFAHESRLADFLVAPILPLTPAPADDPTKSFASDSASAAHPLVGTRVGPYQILDRLGRGGMGEVFLAEDTRLGRHTRRVAVKFLLPQYARDPARLALFKHEAQALAQIIHPHIAILFEWEQTAQTYRLVLEYVPGETLAQQLKRGPLTLDRTLHCARQIADALVAAHKQGVVHRDLKPGNVMITPEGNVKVLDFGLAKLLPHAVPTLDASVDASAPHSRSYVTAPNTVRGTLPYMSPEQTRDSSRVDERTDVWAFGCTLYQMLTGRLPFDGDTTTDILTAIARDEPAWRALPATTPQAIRDLLQRCLTKEREERLSGAAEAMRIIDDELAGRQAKAYRRPPKRVLRLRQAATAAGLALLALLAWKIVPVVTQPPPPQSLAVARFDYESAEPGAATQKCRLMANGLQRTVSSELAKLNKLTVTPADDFLPPTERKNAAEKLGVELVLLATLQCADERVRLNYRLVNKLGVQVGGKAIGDPFTDPFTIQDQLTRKVIDDLKLKVPPPPPPLWRQLSNYAVYLQAMGLMQQSEQQAEIERSLQHLDRYDSEESLNAALQLLEPLARNEPNSAQAAALLGRAYLDRYSLKRDADDRDRAVAECDRASQLDAQSRDVQLSLGHLFTLLKRFAAALAAYERMRQARPDDPDALLGLAEVHEFRARTYTAAQADLRTSDLQAAEGFYLQARDARPGFWGVYNELGGFYYDRGDLDRALENWRQVTILSPFNPEGFNHLGVAYFEKGEIEAAIKAYLQALQLQPSAYTHLNLGQIYLTQERYDEAVAQFERLKQMHPQWPLAWGYLAEGCRDAPVCRNQADRYFAEAIRLGRAQLERDPAQADLRATIAQWLVQRERPAEAQTMLAKIAESDCLDRECLINLILAHQQLKNSAPVIRLIDAAVARNFPLTELEYDPELKRIIAARRGAR